MILAGDSRQAGAVECGLDLTPIVDMVFLLLIFFLAATTFRQAEREMSIALPRAQTSTPIVASLREIVINVDASGAVLVGGHAVDDETLRAMITSAIAANPKQKVSVRGDRATAYANVARVLDICRGAGASMPYLGTVPVR